MATSETNCYRLSRVFCRCLSAMFLLAVVGCSPAGPSNPGVITGGGESTAGGGGTTAGGGGAGGGGGGTGGTVSGGNDRTSSLSPEYANPIQSPVITGEARGFREISETEKLTLPDGETVTVAKRVIRLYLKEDMSAEDYANLLAKLQELSISIIGEDAEMYALQLQVPETADLIETCNVLMEMAACFDAIPDEYFALSVDGQGWSVDQNLYSQCNASVLWWIDAIHANLAWGAFSESIKPGKGVKIVVVDDGYAPQEGAFARSIDYTNESKRVPPYHGTWVTALAAGDGGDTIIDSIGVAWGAEVRVRAGKAGNVQGDRYAPSADTLINALYSELGKLASRESVDWMPTVCNGSFGAGITLSEDEYKKEKYRVYKRIIGDCKNRLVAKDALLVLSAGNKDIRIDQRFATPTNAREQQRQNDYNDIWNRHIITVGACRSADENGKYPLHPFVSGNSVDMVAPGVEIGVGRDLQYPPSGMMQTYPCSIRGTSFSAPLVTGSAALVRSMAPEMTATETKEILHSCGSRDFPGADKVPNASLLDAGAAVIMARSKAATRNYGLYEIVLQPKDEKVYSFDVTAPAWGGYGAQVDLRIRVLNDSRGFCVQPTLVTENVPVNSQQHCQLLFRGKSTAPVRAIEYKLTVLVEARSANDSNWDNARLLERRRINIIRPAKSSGALGSLSGGLSPTLVLTSPNGGESWTAGGTATVTWSSSDNVGDVNIDLSTNGGSTWTTIGRSPNDCWETVTVPNTPSTNCWIWIRQQSGTISDFSNQSFVINVAVPDTSNQPSNSQPTASGQSVSVPFNTATNIALTAADTDSGPQPLTYYIVSQPQHGTLIGTPPNMTYTPTTGYSGSDSFTFKVYDGVDYSSEATVSITVAAGPPTGNTTDDTSCMTPQCQAINAQYSAAADRMGAMTGTEPNFYEVACDFYRSDLQRYDNDCFCMTPEEEQMSEDLYRSLGYASGAEWLAQYRSTIQAMCGQ